MHKTTQHHEFKNTILYANWKTIYVRENCEHEMFNKLQINKEKRNEFLLSASQEDFIFLKLLELLKKKDL